MAKHGSNVYIGRGSVTNLANKWFGSDEEAALETLKERSNEADYNFTEDRFEDPSMTSVAPSVNLKFTRGKVDD